jgi:hypothetical protein
MEIDIYFINGMMLGIEFVPEYEDTKALVVDLFIIRFMFFW